MPKKDKDRVPDETLRAESLEIVERLIAGDTSAAAELARWEARGAAHAKAVAEAMRFLRAVRPAMMELETETELDAPAAPRWAMTRRLVLGGGLAASAAAYLALHPPLQLWPSLAELDAGYRTGLGQQKNIALGAAASAELNTLTSIDVSEVDAERQVRLVAGEAVFTTAYATPDRFAVLAANGTTHAAQARFNIRYLSDTVCVTCINGVVNIQHQNNNFVLSAGHQLSYTASGAGMPVMVDPSLVTAWQNGILVFHDRSLADVVEEVNRYRAAKIIIIGTALARRRVNCSFHIRQLDDVVAQIQYLANAHVTTLPGGFSVLS